MTTVRNYFRTTIKTDNIFVSVSGKYMKIKKDDYLSILKTALIQYER
jgi:hypothetical protein